MSDPSARRKGAAGCFSLLGLAPVRCSLCSSSAAAAQAEFRDAGGVEGGTLSPRHFDEWKERFRANMLSQRLLVRSLPRWPQAGSAAQAVSASVPAGCDAVAAITALAMHCEELSSLTIVGDGGSGDGGGDVSSGSSGSRWEAIVGALLQQPARGSKEGGPELQPLAARLRRLNLSGTSIGDAQLASLAPHCPALLVLRLVGCTQLSDGGIEAVGGGCPALRRLTLGCDPPHGVSASALAKLPGGCEVLELSSTEAEEAATSSDHAYARDVHILDGKPLSSVVAGCEALADGATGLTELETVDVEIKGDEGIGKPQSGGGCCVLQ